MKAHCYDIQQNSAFLVMILSCVVESINNKPWTRVPNHTPVFPQFLFFKNKFGHCLIAPSSGISYSPHIFLTRE